MYNAEGSREAVETVAQILKPLQTDYNLLTNNLMKSANKA